MVQVHGLIATEIELEANVMNGKINDVVSGSALHSDDAVVLQNNGHTVSPKRGSKQFPALPPQVP